MLCAGELLPCSGRICSADVRPWSIHHHDALSAKVRIISLLEGWVFCDWIDDVHSEHMEITRQALRCMHAMCRVLAHAEVSSPSLASASTPLAGGKVTPPPATPATTQTSTAAPSKESASLLNSAKHIKHDYLIEALDVLNANLKSPSVLVQKECIYTLSQLVCISNDLQDRIVDGCLRTVVSILLDPSNDRDVRGAAEDVIR